MACVTVQGRERDVENSLNVITEGSLEGWMIINADVEGTGRSQPTLEQEIRLRSTPRDVPLSKRHLQPLRNRLDEEELHAVLYLARNVVIDIFAVCPGKYHLLDTRSVRSQDLFFDPAYRLDATAECDLGVNEYVRSLSRTRKELYYLSGHGDINGYAQARE